MTKHFVIFANQIQKRPDQLANIGFYSPVRGASGEIGVLSTFSPSSEKLLYFKPKFTENIDQFSNDVPNTTLLFPIRKWNYILSGDATKTIKRPRSATGKAGTHGT